MAPVTVNLTLLLQIMFEASHKKSIIRNRKLFAMMMGLMMILKTPGVRTKRADLEDV